MINIYLDVDGVINAVGTDIAKLPNITGLSRYKHAKAGSIPIVCSQDVVDFLSELGSTPGVAIKWLTTWEEDARTELCPAIGLAGHQWEVLTGEQDDWQGKNWWKLKAIQDDMGKCSPDLALWIDDDIQYEKAAREWADSQPEVLRLSPRTWDGLNRNELQWVQRRVGAQLEESSMARS